MRSLREYAGINEAKGFKHTLEMTKDEWEQWCEEFDAEETIIINLIEQPEIFIVAYADQDKTPLENFATYNMKTGILSTNAPDMFED